MATMRTPEERMAIAQRCVQLEQEGGDILAYLWSENYMTPRATWCNIQREFLGRKPYQYTDGKPKERKVKKVGTIDKRFHDFIEQAGKGMSAKEALTKMGIPGPKGQAQTYRQIRAYAAKKYGVRMAELLPATLKDAEEFDFTALNLQADFGASAPEEKKPQQLQLEAGVDYQIKVAETPEQKRILDGVDSSKVKAPVNFGGYTVTAIYDNELGEFYYDKRYNTIDWRTLDGDEVSMGPIGWKNLAIQIPEILAILGFGDGNK